MPNINKAIPVTDWSSEWKTKNISNVNIFITQSKFFILDDKENKKKLVSEFVSESVSEWETNTFIDDLRS